MTQSLRVGIAGYGLAGRHFHGKLLRGCGFDVVGVMTRNSERAQQAKQDFPDVKVVTRIEDLISLHLDLLVIATATIVHARQAIIGLKAGIPVVVDKPMGLSFAETALMVRTSEAEGVPISVFFNRRWDSDALTVKKVLQEGLLGEVFRVDSRFERFRPLLATATWRERYPPQEGGGLLLDLQPHLISTALDWFGPASLAYSSVRTLRGGADDDVLLVLKHASGVDSYLSASAVIGAPGPRVRVNGTKGTLIIKDLDPQEALLRSGTYPEGGAWNVPTKSKATIHRGEEMVDVESENGNYPQFYELVKGALAGRNPWPVSTADALAVAYLMEAARVKSIR